MQARQATQVFVRRRAAGLVAYLRPLRIAEKRLLREEQAALKGHR
jgi:hypothetical protein